MLRLNAPNHWVYVIREPITGCVKVGKCSRRENIRGRLQSLQTGSPHELEIIATLAPREHPGEDILHRRLQPWRVRPNGEWFYGVPEVFAALAIRQPTECGQD